MKVFWLLLILFLTVGFSPVGAVAAAKLTLTPSTGNQTVGTNFSVTVGVDSGTDKIIGIDLVGSFDATKLEIVSITKAATLGFAYDTASLTPKQNNTTGTFEMTLVPESTSALTGVMAKGDLVVITFKPKVVGSAAVNFTCTPNSVKETNVINDVASDVVDCAANQSGLYTIAAANGAPDPTATPTTSSGGSTLTPMPTKTVAKTELPKTGGIETTMLVVFFGIISLAGAVFLR